MAYGWQHCMTIFRVLTRDNAGHILQNPVSELAARRGAAVTATDGAEQAVDACFDLVAAPGGDFSLGFDGGLTLAYSDADRTCCLTFTDAAMSGGRTSRCVVLDAPCRRLRVAGDASSLEIFLNDGAAVLSTRYYPAGGQVTLRPANFTAAVYPLNL